jgi:hypothetical protein
MNLPRSAARVLAALLVVLSLPIAAWWPGGLGFAQYGAIVEQWLLWTGIAVGLGIIVRMVRRQATLPDLAALLHRLGRDERFARTTLVVAGLAAALYAVTAVAVYDGRPLIIDELVQYHQARLFASGRLWEPALPHPEFLSALNLIEHQGRVFGHFPPGGPALIAVGVRVGLPWLGNVLVSALGVVGMGLLLRRLEPRPAVRTLALLLTAFVPFQVFMAGTQLNHAPMTALATCALAAALLARETQRAGLAVAAGLLAGLGASLRPADAAILAVAIGVWLLAASWKQRAPLVVFWGLGVLAGGSVLLAFNVATTGAPLLLGYRLLWGPNVGFGFHDAPWGEAFTAQIGIERLGRYVVGLQTSLLEAGLPALLPAVIGLVTWRGRWRGADAAMLGAGLLTLVAYGSYWHGGSYVGPRFLHALVPLLALWIARGVAVLWDAGAKARPWVEGGLGAALVCALLLLPTRAAEYGTMLQASRQDPTPILDAAGVRGGTVFVNESWGAQVLARLWAVGVPRWTAERLYRQVDLCTLDRAARIFENRPQPVPAAALDSLDLLRRDSLLLRPSPFSPDTTEQYRPGAYYDDRCRASIERDRAGIALLAPLRLAGPERVVWARDLGERNVLGDGLLPKPWWRLQTPDGAPWRIVPYEISAAPPPPPPSP